MTKLEPKVGLFKTPVPTVGFRDPVCTAHAIAQAAGSNARFRAKALECVVAERRNPDQMLVCSRRQYLHLSFAILCA